MTQIIIHHKLHPTDGIFLDTRAKRVEDYTHRHRRRWVRALPCVTTDDARQTTDDRRIASRMLHVPLLLRTALRRKLPREVRANLERCRRVSDAMRSFKPTNTQTSSSKRGCFIDEDGRTPPPHRLTIHDSLLHMSELSFFYGHTISYKSNQKDDLGVSHGTTSDVDVTSHRNRILRPSSSSQANRLSVTGFDQHVGEKRALTREQKLPSVRTHRGVFRRRCATRLLHRYGSGSVAITRVVVAKCAPNHPSIVAQPFIRVRNQTNAPTQMDNGL